MNARHSKVALIVILEGVVAVLLLAVLYYGRLQLRSLQQQVVENQRLVALVPQQLLAQEAISTELKKEAAALTQLSQLIPSRAIVGDVVARIESEAGKKKVKALVTDVKEEVRLGKDNKPIASTGPYQDIRLTVQSYGDPDTLLTLLHSIEHLPYLLKITDWNITTEYSVLPAALTVAAPTPDAPVESRPAGLLEAGIVITIHKN